MKEHYTYPSWWSRNITWEKLSREEVDRMQSETDECDQKNKDEESRLRSVFKDVLEKAKDIWGEGSNEARYLLAKARVPTKPDLAGWDGPPLQRWEKAVANATNKAKEQEEQQKQKRVLKEKTERAIAWLQARGLSIGKDFGIDNAYARANEISFDEEVKKIKGTFISFSGDDSCENCRGYDGTGNRCDCGNRRVSYVMPEWADFEEMAVIAEAD
jgi:hypothetical protein